MALFLVKHDILYADQFGFPLKHHSIDAIKNKFNCEMMHKLD